MTLSNVSEIAPTVWRLTDAGRSALPPLPEPERWLLASIGAGAGGRLPVFNADLKVRQAATRLGYRGLIRVPSRSPDGFTCELTELGQKRLDNDSKTPPKAAQGARP